eukprot:278614_1
MNLSKQDIKKLGNKKSKILYSNMGHILNIIRNNIYVKLAVNVDMFLFYILFISFYILIGCLSAKKKKKKKKRKYPKYVDPNYPKRPLNAYLRFWLQFQPEFMEKNNNYQTTSSDPDNEGKSNREIMRELAEQWKVADEFVK